MGNHGASPKNHYFYPMNTVFPATYSTLCPEALAILITEKYGFDSTCRLLVRGVGDTYLVEAPGARFILRIYRRSHRSFSNIRAEVELLQALKQENIAVADPIPDNNGNLIQAIQAIEGERHAVLFRYAEGQALKVLNENQLLNFGREMARFHNVSSTVVIGGERWKLDNDSMFIKPLQMLEPFFAEDPEGFNWLKQAAGKAMNELSGLPADAFSSGYCHFDFLPKNVHFKGDAVTFFDFDFMGYGWLVNDLMSFRQHFILDVYLGRTTKEAANKDFATFLRGYREHREISDAALEAIPYLGLGFWLFYMGFHTTHDQFYAFIQPGHLSTLIRLFQHITATYWPVAVP